jgi:hypothetical protein
MLAVVLGDLARKLLKSHGGYRFLVLTDCDDSYILYLFNFITNKSHKVLNQRNVGAKDRT